MTTAMKLLFLICSLPFLVIYISRRIEKQRKIALKEIGGKAAIYGSAAHSLQTEKMQIRKSNRDKGLIGELGVARDLEYLANEYGLTVLHDLSMPGTRANIDHILITPKVLFVIDAKNYTGKVTIATGKDGIKRLRVGGKNQTPLAEKLRTYSDKVADFLTSEGIGIKVVPLLAFYQAQFHEESKLTINGVTVNIFGIENEILRYATAKNPSINIEEVAIKILENFPPKI